MNKIKVDKACVRHKSEFLDIQWDKNLNGLVREMSEAPTIECFKKKI